MRKKLIALFLLVALTFSFTVNVAAETIVEGQFLQMTGLNTVSVRQAVINYLNQRTAYLWGENTVFDSAVVGIANDEAVHRQKYSNEGITLNSSDFSLLDIICHENEAIVSVKETLVYAKASITSSEEIIHTITVYTNENGFPVIVADAYFEVCSRFQSCSYVEDAHTASQMNTSDGSEMCFLYVAQDEVGYAETYDNITKYGEWYGLQAAWCAMFVSWCAEEADIATSVIPKTASPPEMLTHFSNQGNFFYSHAYSGTTSPQAGDIYFKGTSSSYITHVGIVVRVDSSNIYVIDGNCADQVRSHSISRTASNLVGFGRPQYARSVHNCMYLAEDSGHHGVCNHCSYDTGIEPHYFEGYSYDSTAHWEACWICDYRINESSHYLIARSNESHHWNTCAACGYQTQKKAHSFREYNGGLLLVCTSCGYEVITI